MSSFPDDLQNALSALRTKAEADGQLPGKERRETFYRHLLGVEDYTKSVQQKQKIEDVKESDFDAVLQKRILESIQNNDGDTAASVAELIQADSSLHIATFSDAQNLCAFISACPDSATVRHLLDKGLAPFCLEGQQDLPPELVGAVKAHEADACEMVLMPMMGKVRVAQERLCQVLEAVEDVGLIKALGVAFVRMRVLSGPEEERLLGVLEWFMEQTGVVQDPDFASETGRFLRSSSPNLPKSARMAKTLLSLAKTLPSELLGGKFKIAEDLRAAAMANKTLLKNAVIKELSKRSHQ